MPSNTTPPMLKAVILVGGPSKGTRFRPLSLYCPKPLFPIAGEPLFIHHIHALARIPSLQDIYLIGFFEEHSFAPYLDSIHQSYPKLRVRYLREYQPLGTAGGLYHFRDELLKYQTQYLVVLHADMCAHVDLSHLLTWHLTYRATCPDLLATLLAVQVPKASTHCYGCMVIQPHPLEKEEKKEEEEEEEGLEGWHGGSVVHYVEKPDFFLSDYVNAGMYVFDQAIFKYLEHWKPMKRVEDLRGSMKSVFTSFLETHSSVTPPVSSSSSSTKPLSVSTDQLWFEYDVFKQLAGTKKLAAVVPPNPVWFPLKNA
ncbi:Proteasome subunit alpha type-2, partial [Coelomomyces lativittatus]